MWLSGWIEHSCRVLMVVTSVTWLAALVTLGVIMDTYRMVGAGLLVSSPSWAVVIWIFGCPGAYSGFSRARRPNIRIVSPAVVVGVAK